MKVIRIKNNVSVVLEDGSVLNHGSCTDEMYKSIIDNVDNEEAVKEIMLPEFYKKKEVYEVKKDMLEGYHKSKILTVKGASVYLTEVSELTLPEDLAIAIYQAELADDTVLINTYINFWTLASLNPDSRARTNLFWFLQKYGMTISKSGLFVAYRNVVLKNEGKSISSKLAKRISKAYLKVKMKWKKKPANYMLGKFTTGETCIFKHGEVDTLNSKVQKVYGNLQELYNKLNDVEEAPVYTDQYSGKFTIKIGEPVTMPRDKCDSVQENTCSRGLHVAGRSWLQSNYFGNESLIVLVNPADVVAVPPEDSYGKMRVCAYYPVALVERDEHGNIVDNKIPNGFEDEFIDIICYKGEVNNEDKGNYKLEIPNIPELNKNNIYDRLLEIKLDKHIN